MKILMIAPQSFMDEREASSVIYNHSKALTLMGFEVDLVTDHIGDNVDLPGLRVFRIPRLPFMRQVKVGPSFVKWPLNLLVFFLALWRLCRHRYDYLHTYEDAVSMGVILSAISGKRHLYYIHSNFVQQRESSQLTHNGRPIQTRHTIHVFATRHTDAIIVVHPTVEKIVHETSPYTPIYLIKNCNVDEPRSWSIFLQKSLQLQKAFTGKEVTIVQPVTTEQKHTPLLTSQVEKLEETPCAV